MKFLLVAINAKYIHSNLGIYSLKKYADGLQQKQQVKQQKSLPVDMVRPVEIGLAEYTINQQMEYVLQDIYQQNPDAVGFSCYIWNILSVLELIQDLKKIMPVLSIWLGGPEVSYNAEELLEAYPQIEGIITGEGEESFYQLVRLYGENRVPDGLKEVFGLCFRGPNREIVKTHRQPVMDLSQIPFSYSDLSALENRIIYYESSRGCPFSCSYCLSSIDKSVRFRDLNLVRKELDFFLERCVPQVKFVDRTFNCNKRHAMAIWRHILEHDNGVTNFHFEISADLLDQEELALLERMRPGLIQLEIGVQTTNERTIKEIHRSMDLGKLKKVVATINGFSNIHQHLDLIAGLPYEDYDSFGRSFNQVYAMEPEQLQLGFLKVLKGSYMEERAESYGLLYRSVPPYEVLSTRWLNFDGCIRLKGVEEMVEIYYNSGQFRNTMKSLAAEFQTPFQMFEELAKYYKENRLFAMNHSRISRYEILFDFIVKKGANAECYRDLLMYDLYLRENVKSRPCFARDQTPYKEAVKQFFIKEEKERAHLSGYVGYDSRQMAKMAHIEVTGEGEMILFDYKNRDALFGNAKAINLGPALTGEQQPC